MKLVRQRAYLLSPEDECPGDIPAVFVQDSCRHAENVLASPPSEMGPGPWGGKTAELLRAHRDQGGSGYVPEGSAGYGRTVISALHAKQTCTDEYGSF